MPAPDPARKKRSPPKGRSADVFRRNFAICLERSGLAIADLAQATGIDVVTLRRWRSNGAVRPEHDHLERVGKALRLDDPWSLFSRGPEHRRFEIDRASNPLVRDVAEREPALFEAFTPEDWDELYSQRGVGGALNEQGVRIVAERINRKRELRSKFETLLETHHFSTLANVIELMYREAVVAPSLNSNSPRRSNPSS